jgi:hypothetical protein
MTASTDTAYPRSGLLVPLLLLLSCALALAACGGGGGGGSTGGSSSGGSGASTAFGYPTTPVFVLYVPITPVTPVNATGLSKFVLQFPMEPLPTGLSLNADTGVISGTPTSVGFPGPYTIDATAADGKGVSAQVVIKVSPVAANAISYGASAFTYTANVPGQTLTPETAGEAVTGWSISPQLPAGLAFSATTGAISGTLTGASPATTYTVTAKNAAGPLSVSFTIQVESSILVNLGHGSGISTLNFNGSTLLSVDSNGHWVLWNYSSGTMIAFGDSACSTSCRISSGAQAALAGSTVAIRTNTGLQLLSASTGASQGTITTSAAWWQLATDGSYLVTGSTAGLTVWSPMGQVLASHAGDYSSAAAFASPGAVRIATGPAGTNVIESLTVPAGTDSVSPSFNGTFSGWFVDGSAFFSVVGGTTLVYSSIRDSSWRGFLAVGSLVRKRHPHHLCAKCSDHGGRNLQLLPGVGWDRGGPGVHAGSIFPFHWHL